MTKNFCDLCGEPAAAHWPTLRVSFPEMKWSGSKTSAGSISVVDGTWTPYVESRIVLRWGDAALDSIYQRLLQGVWLLKL